MKNPLLLSSFLAFALALAGCAQALLTSSEPATLETDIGDEFQIVLDTDPDAGYQWRLKRGYDQNIIEHLGTLYQDAAGVGTGGADVLTFRCVGAGQATLTFEYYLPNTGQPEEVRVFTIVVEDD